MIDEYPLNRDMLIKAIEQKQIKLIENLLSTSICLIRMAATEETKNQAIISIQYYESIWNETHNFYVKWKPLVITLSEKLKTEKVKLNNELERIESEITLDYQTLLTKVVNLKKKNEQQ